MSNTSDLLKLKAEEEKQDKLNAGLPVEKPKALPPYVEVKYEWRSFLHFLCNRKNGTCLGRTGMNWFTVFVFYIALYATYTAFFFAALFGMYQMIHSSKPRLTGSVSLLKNEPGLGFRPRLGILHKELLQSSLIWVNPDDDDNIAMYTEQLRGIVEAERDVLIRNITGTLDVNYVDCINEPPLIQPEEDNAKNANISICNVYGGPGQLNDSASLYWGDCITEKDFGYRIGKPCVLIRLNRIIGWEPDDSLEEDLRENVKSLHSSYDLEHLKGHVIIECRGQNAWDQELMGPLLLYPGNRVVSSDSLDSGPGILSIPYWYFPYEEPLGYLSPFVMIQFANPTVGVLLQITCEAYNKAVIIDSKYGLGSVTFEILIEPEHDVKD